MRRLAGIKKEVMDAFQDRYPSIEFLLRFIPLNFDSEHIDTESRLVPPKLPSQGVCAIYVYGIGLGEYYDYFKEWLREKKENLLIFIEESIDSIHLFLQTDRSIDIIKDRQVHIRFNMNRDMIELFLGECSYDFPVENIEVLASPSYKKRYRYRFDKIKLKLQRLTVVSFAFFAEKLCYNFIFENVFPNFKRCSGAFFGNKLQNSMLNIPAIVCGAGPSLDKDMDELRGLDNKCVIFAAGSAVTSLSNKNILPHFIVAVDPTLEEYERFKGNFAFEVPIFYENRVCSSIFNTFNGPHSYISSHYDGSFVTWIERKLGLKGDPLKEGFDIEAMSVTTEAIQLACTLGCNPIIFLGVDLAFTDKKLYASGVKDKGNILKPVEGGSKKPIGEKIFMGRAYIQ